MQQQCRRACGVVFPTLVLLLAMAGCGKSLRTGADPNGITRVSVAASTDGTVRSGETKRFQAVATSGAGEPIPTDFAWSLEPANLGVVSGQGAEALVTGQNPGNGKLVALASNGVRGEYPITIVVGPVADLKVEAKNGKTAIEAGDSESFQVTGVDMGGNVVGQSRSRVILSPAWSVNNGIGTIDVNGVFTAAAAGIGKTGQIVAKVDSAQGTLNVSVTQGSRALYVGADTCKSCHADVHTSVMQTRHTGAMETLKGAHQENNPACVACHTAGYGKGGYVNEEVTPQLAGVQCENCHGPGSQHVAGHGDKTKIVTGAAVESAAVCGSCHTGSHHPNNDEWATSAHARVDPHVAESLLTGGEARQKSCGPCHSGAARLAMLKNKPLPSGQEAAEVGITCVVCHDPHTKTQYGSQLRNPLASTQPFSYSTAGTTSFAAQYDPTVNLCAQCHNARGAKWQDSSRPPHHSVQYTLLSGSGGVEEGVVPQSAHRNLQKQCTQCHMGKSTRDIPTEQSPNITGHTFMVQMQACNPCHTEADAGARAASTQTDVHQRVAAVKARLDKWGTTMAPAALSSFGARAWEFNVPGVLSNPSGDPAIQGPTSAQQSSTNVPDAIKQARFNLYLVEHDGSYGIHNAKYTRYLLDVANSKLDSLNVPR